MSPLKRSNAIRCPSHALHTLQHPHRRIGRDADEMFGLISQIQAFLAFGPREQSSWPFYADEPQAAESNPARERSWSWSEGDDKAFTVRKLDTTETGEVDDATSGTTEHGTRRVRASSSVYSRDENGGSVRSLSIYSQDDVPIYGGSDTDPKTATSEKARNRALIRVRSTIFLETIDEERVPWPRAPSSLNPNKRTILNRLWRARTNLTPNIVRPAVPRTETETSPAVITALPALERVPRVAKTGDRLWQVGASPKPDIIRPAVSRTETGTSPAVITALPALERVLNVDNTAAPALQTAESSECSKPPQSRPRNPREISPLSRRPRFHECECIRTGGPCSTGCASHGATISITGLESTLKATNGRKHRKEVRRIVKRVGKALGKEIVLWRGVIGSVFYPRVRVRRGRGRSREKGV